VNLGAGPEVTGEDSPATGELERLQRRAARERAARKEAEALLETRSGELYRANEALTRLAASLESQVEARTADLARAVARAESATRAKTSFLATMSHELRTPMNGVIGMAQLLLDSGLTEEQRRQAEMIQESGDLLLSIINDILDLSRIEAGQLELEARVYDPRASIASIETLLRPSARKKDLALVVHVDAGVPQYILGDDMRLRQVLLNLVSNAIKFTRSGRVEVRLDAAAPQADGDAALVLSVSDTGIGLAADRLAAVFEPFAQAHASTARLYGGSGLGLAICRRIAELMQGRLDVESELGRGSTFRLQWQAAPGAKAAAIPPPVQSASSTAPDRRALRVLLAEDNEVNQTLACALLAKLGLHADVVGDGEAALEHVQRVNYDLVLMDVQMPRLDGLTAVRRMRSLPLPQQPRVVAITANAFEEDRAACLAAGMDDFLAKPFRVQDFARVIAQARDAKDASGTRVGPV